ncbi:MAG: tetratricopeptide repeat protein [Gammaproteobacteria bacterium]|nr:tetratricopeptide repeat protein [Gammaproteobacteria bacterium]
MFIRLFLLAILIMGLAACTTVSKNETVSGDDVARSQLDGDLLFQLLAGEFAGVRGELSRSVDYYLEAIEATDDAAVASRAAHIALYAGRYNDALTASKRWQALAKDEDIAIARLQILVYLHLQQVENAILAIEQLLLVDGKVNDRAVGSLGHILQQEAVPETALAVLAALNQRHPQQVRLLLLQGRLEAKAKHLDKSLQLVEQVIALDPEISDAYLIKAQVLAAQNKQKAAVAAVAMAVEKRPQDNRLRLQYARMLVQMKDYDRAWTHFMQLKKAMPDDENVLLSLGLLSIEINKTDQAKQFLQELIDKGYHNSQAHYYLARIQQSHGELMPAIANYERVSEGEFLLDARIRTAGLLAQMGKVDDALEKLKLLINPEQNNNNQIRIYLAQGEVLRSVQRNREALNLYTEALAHAPENTDLLYARALTAEKLNMLEMTESDLRMVLTHEPENANALNALGYTLADRTERFQEAKEYIQKAARLLPDDPAILDSLGWVYFRLGQYEKSIEWLRKAFARLQDAEIAAHLGEALWKNGQLEDARKIWQRGLEIKADHSILLNTIKRHKQ